MGHGMPMGGPEDIMTIIMGLPGPMAPGMHGPLEQPDCVQPAVEFATKIRDMADEFLKKFDKECSEGEGDDFQQSVQKRSEDSKEEQVQEEDTGGTDRRGEER